MTTQEITTQLPESYKYGWFDKEEESQSFNTKRNARRISTTPKIYQTICVPR